MKNIYISHYPLRVAWLMAAAAIVLLIGPAALRAEPGIKSIKVKNPEIGDVREILGIRSVIADFELTEPAKNLKFYCELYKNGEFKEGTPWFSDLSARPFGTPVTAATISIQIADLDYLPVGDTAKAGQQMVTFSHSVVQEPIKSGVSNPPSMTSTRRALPKEIFDISETFAPSNFFPSAGKGGKFPIFYIAGRSSLLTRDTYDTVEELVKKNPTTEFLVAYVEIGDGPANIAETKGKLPMSAEGKVVMSDEEWKKILSPEQFTVLRGKGTECAFKGAYWDEHRDGVYECAGCGQVLFDTKTKFNSGTGWPSFYDAIDKKAVKEIRDLSHGMIRTEVQCARCDGHLGHVFEDGPKPTGLRFCINSAALKFVERKGEANDAAKEKAHE